MGRGGFFSIGSLQGVYALIVDQEPESRALLVSILRYASAFVVSVDSPTAALRAMHEVKPDVAVVNVASSKHGDGFMNAVRGLKPEAGGVLPMIAITAEPDDRERLLGQGCTVVLMVPLDPWELCRVVAGITLAT